MEGLPAEVHCREERAAWPHGPKRYWSGISRREQLKQVGQLLGGGEEWLLRFYKLQSWEAHHVMSYPRNVRAAAPVNGVVEVGVGFGTEPGNAEKLAGYADSLLRMSWTTFCESFHLPTI